MALEALLLSFVGGGALGFAAGFAIKRIIKVGLVIVGAFLLGLMFLSYKGIVRVDWNQAQNATEQFANQTAHVVMNVVNNTAAQMAAHPDISMQYTPMSFAGGFIAGFVLGLRH